MSDTLRITGMASGLDVDSMVKTMMKPENMKVDKAKQDQQVVQWKQDLYRDIMSDLNTFKSAYFDVLKPDSYMMSSNNFAGFDVSNTDISGTVTGQTASPVTGATATALAGASAGTYTVNVTQLADGATRQGSVLANGTTRTTTLASLGMTDSTLTFNLSYNSTAKAITISNTDTIDQVASKISAATSGNVKASFSELTRQFTLKTITTGSTQSLSLDKNLSFLGLNNTVSINGGTLVKGTTSANILDSGAFNLTYKDSNGMDQNTSMSISPKSTLIGTSSEKITDSLVGKDVGVNITVGSKTYIVDSPALSSWDGSGSESDFINLLNNANDGSGNKLSSVATISGDGSNLTITNNISGANPISINFTGNDADSLKTLMGMESTSNTTGATNSINDVIAMVSNQTGGRVTATFDPIKEVFSLNSFDGSPISISGVDGSASAGLALLPGTGNVVATQGKDAQVSITPPGSSTPVPVSKPTNTFSIDGINYTLVKANTTTNVTVTTNTQKTYDKIKAFVDKYNDLVDKINSKLTERRNYDYKPLTDDQKSTMKDTDITLWENKAKQGLLANDSILSNILSNMRSAFYEPVKVNEGNPSTSNIGISLSDIGITTSSDISQRGKLIIDDTKLKNALQNNGDKVAQLFTKVSTAQPSYNPNMNYTDRSSRNKEEGIFQRISDVLQDNLRTVRDKNGRKGVLLEKAGIQGDYTEFHNVLTDDILSRDKLIKTMVSKLSDKENAYYLQFSKLEQAMQQSNSQSSWLSQQISSMGR